MSYESFVFTPLPYVEDYRRESIRHDIRFLKGFRKVLRDKGYYYLLSLEAQAALDNSITLSVERLVASGR